MLNLNHKNLDVWKISVELVADIYELTEKFPKTEIFGLSNQLRRASFFLLPMLYYFISFGS